MGKKKLHILFLNSWYPSRVLPQNGDFIQRHAEAVALLHRVTAVHVITDPELQKDRIEENIKNGVRTLIAYLKPTSFPGLKWVRFFKAYQSLMKKAGSYDLIHVNRIFPAGLMVLFAKRPFIITEHYTGFLPELSDKLSKTERFLTKKLCHKAKFICPVSLDLAAHMQALGFKGNYRIVPNVVDTELFYPSKPHNEVFTLIHISSLNDRHKNIKGMLRVIRRLQDVVSNFKFILIGPEPSRFDDFIAETGNDSSKIKKTGMIPHEEIPRYLQSADVLLQFSRYENLPCVILEAFSCGIPVVSTDVGGIKEFFPSEFGQLIPEGDETALLDAILDIHSKRNSFDTQAMHRYATDHFSKRSIAKAYNQIYKEALNITS